MNKRRHRQPSPWARPARSKRRLRFLLYLTLGGESLFLFLSTVPVVPYHPICGSYYRNTVHLKGPLRPEYQAWLKKIMTESNFYYWKIGDQIFIRYFNFFDGPEDSAFDRHYLHVNVEWRLIKSLAQGHTATQSDVPPPQPLLDAIRATEHKYGPFDPNSEMGPSRRFRDCAVKRAGAIWVEKLDDPAKP